MRFALLTVVIGVALAGAATSSDENVRQVQTKLKKEGLYFGEIDGAYSSDLSAALTRYQVRNGLPITGQLDTETSEALGAKPAVTNKSADDSGESSKVWRHLRRRDQQSLTRNNARRPASPGANETRATNTSATDQSREEIPTTAPGKQAPTIASDTGASTPEFSAERLRDYVAAFVLAGLDRNVGAEAEFFSDRVEYYDDGTMGREKIREDLKRYDERWPERHFWLAGNITVEPENDNRARVTFPLGFKLRNGNRTVSGKVNKSLVLEAAGGDLQIVAVNERKD